MIKKVLEVMAIIFGLMVVFRSGYVVGKYVTQQSLRDNESYWECTIDTEPENGYCISANDWQVLTR